MAIKFGGIAAAAAAFLLVLHNFPIAAAALFGRFLVVALSPRLLSGSSSSRLVVAVVGPFSKQERKKVGRVGCQMVSRQAVAAMHTFSCWLFFLRFCHGSLTKVDDATVFFAGNK